MSTIRVRKDANYFAASNEPFNDVSLSWESRGLMGYLLSKPDNWKISMKDLENKGPAGNHKLRRMLAELRKAGYMNRVRLTVENNKFDWITEVYESPSQNPKRASGGFSTSGSPTSGKPPDIVSTNLTSTEKESTTGAKPNIFKWYESNIGPLTAKISDVLKDAESIYPADWIEDAITIAVKQQKRNWAYCEAILKRWKIQGKDSGENPHGKNKNQKHQDAQPEYDYDALRKQAAEHFANLQKETQP